MYGKKGENAVNGQCVQMLDKQNKVVKEFRTVGLAVNYLGLKGHTQLYNACKNGTEYKGYFWRKTERCK